MDFGKYVIYYLDFIGLLFVWHIGWHLSVVRYLLQCRDTEYLIMAET